MVLQNSQRSAWEERRERREEEAGWREKETETSAGEENRSFVIKPLIVGHN